MNLSSSIKLTRPTLLLDKSKVLLNLERMSEKAKNSGVLFRPHFKTHQSGEIGNWFRDFGVSAITVSSVKMAEYFTSAGWKDITIAFPVNILEIDSINHLAEKINLSLLVESVESVDFLKNALTSNVNIFIKIDTGSRRTGVDYKNIQLLDLIVKEIIKSKQMTLKGFLTHSGHTYKTGSKSEIIEIYTDTISKLTELKRYYENTFPELIISIGDTPACSLVENLSDADEIRPGNFVFYDLMQYNLGCCELSDIAMAVACPVVALHPEREQVILYGGAVHFSKESYVTKNSNCYGKPVIFKNNTWEDFLPEAYLSSVSQEHGTVSLLKAFNHDIKVGDVLTIIPVHSCLTANPFQSYLTLENAVIEKMIS